MSERWQGTLILALAVVYWVLTYGSYVSEKRREATGWGKTGYNLIFIALLALALWFTFDGGYSVITGERFVEK